MRIPVNVGSDSGGTWAAIPVHRGQCQWPDAREKFLLFRRLSVKCFGVLFLRFAHRLTFELHAMSTTQETVQ
jgi:hypothetical protein